MFVESELKREMASLGNLLGDTRALPQGRDAVRLLGEAHRCRSRDRGALSSPLSDELQLEVRSLAARLRVLDPH